LVPSALWLGAPEGDVSHEALRENHLPLRRGFFGVVESILSTKFENGERSTTRQEQFKNQTVRADVGTDARIGRRT
jgi:hypothetical protein